MKLVTVNVFYAKEKGRDTILKCQRFDSDSSWVDTNICKYSKVPGFDKLGGPAQPSENYGFSFNDKLEIVDLWDEVEEELINRGDAWFGLGKPIKPRIFREFRGDEFFGYDGYVCTCGTKEGRGKTPESSYNQWLEV